MKFMRIKKGDRVLEGVFRDGMLQVIEGTMLSDFRITDELVDPSADGSETLSPVSPSKVVAVGLNYRDHAEELGQVIPSEPMLFMKPSTSVIGHEAAIVYPPSAGRIDYEAELAAVIGKRSYRVSEEEAPGFILGYTCLNDVTARDLQSRDGQWTRAKSFDTFCPVGPVIETVMDPNSMHIESRVNGEVRQSSNTRNFIFDVFQLVSFVSHIMTLLPGDIVTTGTPSGIGPVVPGDTVEIEVEGIGVLRNSVTG